MCHSSWYKWTVLEATSPLIFTPIQSATVTLLITLYNMIVETQGLILWNIHQRASERYKTCSICASLFPGVRLYFLVCFLVWQDVTLFQETSSVLFIILKKGDFALLPPCIFSTTNRVLESCFMWVTHTLEPYVSYTHSRTLCELHTL